MLLEEGVCYDQCVLLTKPCQPLPCFILYSKEKLVCYSRYLLTAYCCIPIPYDVKDIFGAGGGGLLVLESVVGLHRTSQFQLLQHQWLGHAAAAAAAAKSIQSCPTLCDTIDSSPLGSSVPGILQARTLEWVAISFSNA